MLPTDAAATELSDKREAETQVQGLLLRLVLSQRGRDGDDRSATRERILTVSIPLFARRGYAGTSMRDIAREVGIKASSIYEYFSGKDQLLHEALVAVLGQFHAFLIDALDADSPPRDQLRALVRQHVVWQRRFFEVAGAWDVLADVQRISRVLSEEAIEDLRARRALYHDLVHALVIALRPGGSGAKLRAEALLSLCDRVDSWADENGSDDDVADVAWSLAQAVIDAPLPHRR